MSAAKNHASGFDREDRDLLVELRTEMTAVRQDIKELKDNTAARLSLVEAAKHDKADAEAFRVQIQLVLDDHEKRIRINSETLTKIVTYGSSAMVGLTILQIALPYLIK